MRNHSRGPWSITKPDWLDKGTYCVGIESWDIAIAQTFILGGDEEANAHLIAAAPDLLEALANLCSVCDKMEGVSDEAFRSAERKAREAMAKAAGSDSS